MSAGGWRCPQYGAQNVLDGGGVVVLWPPALRLRQSAQLDGDQQIEAMSLSRTPDWPIAVQQQSLWRKLAFFLSVFFMLLNPPLSALRRG
jgi:hypothetical protein